MRSRAPCTPMERLPGQVPGRFQMAAACLQHPVTRNLGIGPAHQAPFGSHMIPPCPAHPQRLTDAGSLFQGQRAVLG